MTMNESRIRVVERNMACVDVLAVACEHDHGTLEFDDPRRSIAAVEAAALRLIEDHGWEDGVAALAMMAANMLRQAVGVDDIDRVRELLEKQRMVWTEYGQMGRER